MSYIVQGTLRKNIISYECDTISEVKEKLHFIKLDREKYGREWTKVNVLAIGATDVTKLFKEYL